jgi:hypothetical protein
MAKFKEGDIVQVTDRGQTYTAYESLARRLKLENFIRGTGNLPVEERTYMVIREPDELQPAIYGIQSLKTEQEFMIHERGLKHAEEV